MEMITEIIAWASFPFGALLAGASLAIAAFYVKTDHRNYPHIVCMALSFSMMTVLLVATLNYRIFFSGWQRFVGALGMLLAFIIATIGLVLIYKWRARDVRERP